MAAVAGPAVAAVPVVAQVGEQALPVRRQRVAGAVRAVPFPMNFSTIATAWVWAWRNWARLPPIPTICAGFATKWPPTTFDIPLPRTADDVERYDAGVKAAKDAGGYDMHAALTQRRYEQFDNMADFQKSFEQNRKSVALAEPVLRKYKMRLALENHKGWTAVEQAAWLKSLGTEYVGVHFDFGNNVSLLEDPMVTLETLKPYIFSCHIKDMAVQPYEKGFLLSEVPMGDGFLDLKKMVDTLRAKNPEMPMDLEMITRDPLEIPIYTDKYWATFTDIPGKQVAHMMEIILKNPPKKPLPKTTGLDAAARQKQELDNNIASIKYARQYLGL